MDIRALPTEVRNALRTGLIITNASQCVFELVLNSLDAGATSIAIRVDLIAHKLQVVDNGCGMDNHTLDLVGLRYMTSKCHSLEDLRKPLGKFGFRGEALASLRNVSRLLMLESRGDGNIATFCKVFKEGKAFDAVLSKTQRPSRGTTVTVQDFMYNMPVRRHRIRDALNLEEIKGLIEATALTHPQVSFSLRNDVNGSIIIQTFKTSDTLKTFSYLFGQEIAQSLVHVKHPSGNFKVYGYISNEAHFQNNLQFIYVNKRLVNKTKLHKFVTSLLVKSSIFRTNGWREDKKVKSNANGNWLDYSPAPKRETFPVYLLNIKCAYTEYDVSFDPKKSLLEFKNWESVLRCLDEAITTFLAEKHLSNVVDTNTENARDKSADASDLSEIVELAKERALGLVKCVLSDHSTKESRDNDGTKIIRGYPAYRQDKQDMIDYDHDPSEKRNQISHIETSHISTIKCLSKCVLEPKTQHMASQLIPKNRWVEDPLTPSPATNAKRVFVNTISLSKLESTLLSEDPMVYSDNEQECQKYNENHGHSSINENGIVRTGSHVSIIEAREESCFKSMFSLPLFPNNKNNEEYIGLRDIMRRALLMTLQNLSRTRQKHGSRDKTVKRNVLKVTERKFTVNHSFTIQSKTSKNNIVRRGNENELPKTSAKLDVIKSPYFEFKPVVVKYNENRDKLFNAPLQCVRSPYFAKALPQPDNHSLEHISNSPPVVQSPYFKSLASHCKTNTTVNTFQPRNCRQTVQIEKPIHFGSRPTQLKPCNIARCIGLPENASLSRVAGPAADLPKPHNYSSKQYAMHTRNCYCPPNERIDVHLIDNHVSKHLNNCQLPPIMPPCRHFLRPSDNSRYCPSRPLTLFKPKRNYLTTADLICTLETVRRNYNSPTDLLSFEEYIPSPMYRRPTVTWGNIQCHPRDEWSQSHDRSDNPSNPSNTSRSSVSYGDSANNNWQSSVQTSLQVVGDGDQSPNLGSVYRRSGECRHSPSSHDGDNELTTETDWTSRHKDTIRIGNNRLEFQSMRDNIQGGSERSSPQYNLECSSTCVAPAASYELELDDGGYAPQFDESIVSNVTSTGPRESPPMVKFNQLFSFSTPEDDRHEPSSVTGESVEEETVPITLIGRKRDGGDVADDIIISKKPRWENGVVEESSIADSTERKHLNGMRDEGHTSADSESVRSGASIGDTISERSSGEDFLTHILQEKPLKCNPNRQLLDDSADLATREKVQQITPYDVKEGCQLIDAMHVSDSGDEEVSITSTSLEDALNVDEDHPPEYGRQTSEEVPGCAMDTDRQVHSEDTRVQHADHSEWVRRLDAAGNTFFVHSRTGMTSFEGPVSSNGGDPYSMTSRYDFLPKGMSPILKEKAGMATTTGAWNPGAVGNDELSTVKWWRDDLPKCEDLIKQMVEDAEKRMTFCEPAIPDMNIQDRTAVGVYHLLTSYTFTKDVFTCLEVLGQLDNKFIVTLVSVESEKSPHLLVVLFDQHAVDERIRLEHLVEDYLTIGEDTHFKSTPIESPIVVNLNAQELRIVSSYKKEFQRIGLEFESPTETSLKVTSAPSCLKARESRHRASLVETLLKGHATAIVSGGGVGPRIPNTLQTVINSEACRGAIKFGDALSIEECKSMLTCLSECTLPFQCAHGRPSLIPIADMTQIQEQQQQHTKVETKPNYLNLKENLR